MPSLVSSCKKAYGKLNVTATVSLVTVVTTIL